MPANGERKEEKFVNLVRVIFSDPNHSQQLKMTTDQRLRVSVLRAKSDLFAA